MSAKRSPALRGLVGEREDDLQDLGITDQCSCNGDPLFLTT
jgi:hypothetical protein